MAFSFLYLAVRAVFGALVRSRRGLHVKDVELLVLRHELEILRRQVAGPKFRMVDRALLAAACGVQKSGSSCGEAVFVDQSAEPVSAPDVVWSRRAGGSERWRWIGR
jgi:hypothetical protein